jgi:TM2 domain-containing membrane protein YozV
MLDKKAVAAEEERLREEANRLPPASRKAFYQEVSEQLKDPDTYAALNWFFVAGLHHFYLGRWWNGLADLVIFLVGVALIVAGFAVLGVAVILLVSAWELWALFRSQVIVQDWNNKLYRRALERHLSK